MRLPSGRSGRRLGAVSIVRKAFVVKKPRESKAISAALAVRRTEMLAANYAAAVAQFGPESARLPKRRIGSLQAGSVERRARRHDVIAVAIVVKRVR